MDIPLVYQLFCQGHSWVATYGRDKRALFAPLHAASALEKFFAASFLLRYIPSNLNNNQQTLRKTTGQVLDRLVPLSYMHYCTSTCDNSGEDTPVPISNTEVKLSSADDTWWEAAWESRSLPVSVKSIKKMTKIQ